MGGQVRALPGGAIIGWDMGAALSMARALGVDPLVAAEILPTIEAIAVRGMNQNLSAMMDNEDGFTR